MQDFKADDTLDNLIKAGKVVEFDGKFYTVPLGAIKFLAERIKILEEKQAAFH